MVKTICRPNIISRRGAVALRLLTVKQQVQDSGPDYCSVVKLFQKGELWAEQMRELRIINYELRMSTPPSPASACG